MKDEGMKVVEDVRSDSNHNAAVWYELMNVNNRHQRSRSGS